MSKFFVLNRRLEKDLKNSKAANVKVTLAAVAFDAFTELCLFKYGPIRLGKRRGLGAAEAKRESHAACNAVRVNRVFYEFVSH